MQALKLSIQSLFTISDSPVLVTAVFIAVFAGILILSLGLLRKRDSKIKISLLFLGVIFLLRLFVTLFGRMESTEYLNVPEKILDSLIHALQTFSMDESYTEYTVAGKAFLESSGLPNWAFAYGLFISIMNICAPILGGALLLDIIAGIFPVVRIKLHPFRHKYVFSGLNERSVALAEDIIRNGNYRKLDKDCKRRPLLIFTGTGGDPDSVSELFTRAKNLGGLCVSCDLFDLSLRRSTAVTYLLINGKTSDNITSFSRLVSRQASGKDCLFPLPSEGGQPRTKIFVFIQEGYESDTVYKMAQSSPAGDKIIVRAIKDYMNAAINLMWSVPLFLPLLEEDGAPAKKKELNITIIESGYVAFEVFKAVFWCGQMLDTDLNVNVVTSDKEGFRKLVEDTCPELTDCCRKGSEKLRVSASDKDETRNPPYLNSLTYTEVADPMLLSEYPEEIFTKTHYYVIALRDDTLDIKLTGIIDRKLAALRLAHRCNTSSPGCPGNVVIAPAVFNSELAHAIKVTEPDPLGSGAMIVPFSTFEDRFCCRNVFMTEFSHDALELHRLYMKSDSGRYIKDAYSETANNVRSAHAPYKMFSLGLLKRTNKTDSEGNDLFYELNFDGKHTITEKEYYSLAWLEHRRWTAFLRSQGFTVHDSRAAVETYSRELNSNKNLALKIHPCLVECSREKTKDLDLHENTDPSAYETGGFDRLDFVSAWIFSLGCTGDNFDRRCGFKQFDYLEEESSYLKDNLEYHPQSSDTASPV